MTSRLTDEELLMDLQDLIEDALSGRKERHRCPKCGKKNMTAAVDEAFVKFECPDCGWFFEGRLQ